MTVPVYPTLRRLPLRRRQGTTAPFPFGAPGGVWTFSGRVALYHGLRRLDLPRGSTILVPTYHQGVEIDTLLAAGHRLRYYRLTQSLAIDWDDLERRFDPTVSALYLIHYAGFPQSLTRARAFCEAHRLKLIEDCALALFSRHEGRWLGSEGDLALFSVYKTLPLPHGGFLVTKTEGGPPPLPPALRRPPLGATAAQTSDLLHHTLGATVLGAWSRRVTSLPRALGRLVGWKRERTIYSGGAGWDSRLLSYGAARWVPGVAALIDPDTVIRRRQENYARLAARLRGLLPCPFPDLPAEACPLYFVVLVGDKAGFQDELARLGVQSVNLWDATHATCPADLADEVRVWRSHCVELPIHQALNAADIERVAGAALVAYERQRAPTDLEVAWAR